MQYYASYYWQESDENASSLILQQVYHKRRKISVVLACVCRDRGRKVFGGHFVKVLAEWFYKTGLPMCDKGGGKKVGITEKSLAECIRKELKNYALDDSTFELVGVMCVGQSMLLFQQGENKIFVLNSRSGYSNCEELILGKKGNSALRFQGGVIQKGAGILLATPEFFCNTSNRIMGECLNVKALRTQEQLDSRMKELGDYGKQQTSNNMSAIVIAAR